MLSSSFFPKTLWKNVNVKFSDVYCLTVLFHEPIQETTFLHSYALLESEMRKSLPAVIIQN